jgi:diguanylate cyclase (GGDEF)-like protein/PAS domain S-box-containing protein
MVKSDGHLLKALYDHLPDGVFLIDPSTSFIVDCNLAALEQVGMQKEEVLNHSVLSLQADVVGMTQWESICTAIRASKAYVFVGKHRHSSGAEVPVEVNTSHFEHEGRAYFLSIARNITERLAIEHDLSSRDAQLRYALTEASDGLWDWNLSNDEVFFSPQLQRMLGYGPSEMQTSLSAWSDNIHPEEKGRVMHALHEHIQGAREKYEAEYRLKNRNGHYIWVLDRGRVCERNAHGQATRVVGMVQNVTDRKNTELALQNLATYDVLTGLLNRRECERILPLQWGLCQRLGVSMSVCLIDVDHFKRVNDQFGHQVGDHVLRSVTKTLKSLVRSTDYLFRWGGEEFLLICTGTRSDDMVDLANKLRLAVEGMQWPDVPGLNRITCCFGVSSFPDVADNPNCLFLSADSALYRAKAKGRNCVEVATLPPP